MQRKSELRMSRTLALFLLGIAAFGEVDVLSFSPWIIGLGHSYCLESTSGNHMRLLLQKSIHSQHNETTGFAQSNTNDFGNEKIHLAPEFSLRRRRVLKWSAPILAAGLAVIGPGAALDVPAARAQTPKRAVSEVPNPIIPFSSTRRYKRISLRNGLSVLLVSDKNVAVCQAAMSIPAGQFYDGSVPGLAHLMEHMVLSTPVVTLPNRQGDSDLESWLSEREGASNAFTANQKVCFHLTCPKQVFPETLERFATVFRQRAVEAVCRDRNILRREIRRVDSELNFDSVYSQEEYLTKVRKYANLAALLTKLTGVCQSGTPIFSFLQRQH